VSTAKKQPQAVPAAHQKYFASLPARAAIPALFWWALTGGEPASWWIGLPAVLLAASVSAALATPLPSLPFLCGIFRFLPCFLLLSLRGGIDVSRRALSPALPLAPSCVAYPLRLPGDAAAVFFADCISLLPGTLSVELAPDRLLVHILDHRKPVLRDLAELEKRVARLFGLALTPGEEQ